MELFTMTERSESFVSSLIIWGSVVKVDFSRASLFAGYHQMCLEIISGNALFALTAYLTKKKKKGGGY